MTAPKISLKSEIWRKRDNFRETTLHRATVYPLSGKDRRLVGEGACVSRFSEGDVIVVDGKVVRVFSAMAFAFAEFTIHFGFALFAEF